MKRSKIIYTITVEDVQKVASEELGKQLTASELKIVEEKIGDYIHWYDIIHDLIELEVIQPATD